MFTKSWRKKLWIETRRFKGRAFSDPEGKDLIAINVTDKITTK